MAHENNDPLLSGGFSILRFDALPITHQLAIVQYWAVDGEAWEWPEAMENAFTAWSSANPNATHQQRDAEVSRLVVDNLQHFVSSYGDMQVGVALVDMAVVKQHVLAIDQDIDGHGSWDAYHAWYMGAGGVPSHSDSDRWPCIVSGMDDEAFEDGWHRLHSYAASGHADLPVVFFPSERHFDHEARMDESGTNNPKP